MATRLRATSLVGTGWRAQQGCDAEGYFVLQSSDMAKAIVARGYAEYAPLPTSAPGRPTKAAQREAAQQTGKNPDLEDYNREDLLDMAIKRDIVLPQGYIRKDQLIRLLRGQKVEED